MSTWLRQHRESLWYRIPWHLPGEASPQAATRGLTSARCGESITVADRGVDELEDPPLDDRCPACQGAWQRNDRPAI